MLLIKLLLIVAVLYALVLGRAWRRVHALVFRPPGLRPCGADDIGAAELLVLDLPRAWLQAQGFRHAGWLHASELLCQPGQERRTRAEALYLSADGRIRCHVGVSPLPRQGIPYLLRFVSTRADGSERITVNCAGALPAPPGIEVVDAYAASDGDQLAAHRAGMGDAPCRGFDDLDAACAHSSQVGATLFAWWREHRLQPRGDTWGLTWPAAWQFLRLLQRHQARLRQVPPPPAAPERRAADADAGMRDVPADGVLPAGMAADGEAAPMLSGTTSSTSTSTSSGAGDATAPAAGDRSDALRHAEAAMLAQQLDGEAAGAGKGKAGVFVLTALGFLLLGKLYFGGSWAFIAALMIVLLVHELGHYLAMRVFGYRDLGIFFLPLLGAAAQGRKDNAPPWQQLVILLAGPVPGLLLALGALAWFITMAGDAAAWPEAGRAFVIDLIAISVVVNALNLLPVQPLDGGRVAELLFFSRFPRASFGFFAAGVVVLGLGALYLQDPVLGVLALVLAIGLPAQWRLASVARALRPYFGSAPDRGQALLLVAQALGRGAAPTWPPVTRLNIARALLPRLQGGLPGRATLLVGSVVYLGLLLSPLLLATDAGKWWSPLRGATAMTDAGAANRGLERLQDRLARAQTTDDKLRAHLALYYWYAFPAPTPGQGTAAAPDAKAAAQARAHLEAAWQLLPADNPLAAGRVAQGVMTAYVQDRARRDPAAGLALHEDILHRLEARATVADQARWLQFRDVLLAEQKAPRSERIANRLREVALWERAAGADITAGVATGDMVQAMLEKRSAVAAASGVGTGTGTSTSASNSSSSAAGVTRNVAATPTAAGAAVPVASPAPAAPAPAATPALNPVRIDPELDLREHESRAGLLLARRELALLLREDGRADVMLALLRLNHAQSLRLPAGDDYRYLRDSSLADLAWALAEAGRGLDVAPLFAGYQPLPDPFVDVEEDPWHFNLPEQAQAWAALQAGDTATALAIFSRLRESARRVDPGVANPLLAVALDLDLLLAQQRAGRSDDITRTQRELADAMAKIGDSRYLAGTLQMVLADPYHIARSRAQAHRDLLCTLGYAVTVEAAPTGLR